MVEFPSKMRMIIKTSLFTQEKCMFRGFCHFFFFFLHDFAFKNLKKVIALIKEKNFNLNPSWSKGYNREVFDKRFAKQGSTLDTALSLFP